VPSENEIAEVVVDKDVVDGRKEPVRVLKGKEQAA
jgi:ATP-dependent Clp protease ATP-binding subunit ClpX